MKKFALLICTWMALIAPGQFTANAQPTNISAINTGAANNDKSGDTLRIAFGKINTNFSYLTNLVRTITNSIGSVANITSITNRVGIVENVNGAQDAALIGLTNSIATKQNGTLYLSNLNAWAISNIISANANITLATNNGVLTITGVATNFDATGLTARLNQADVTNVVQQTALAGLTNSIANLNTNYIATTNGTAYNLAIVTGTLTNITERMGTNINPVIQGAREISGNIGLLTNGTIRGTVLTNVTVSGTLSGPGDIGTNSQKFGLSSYAGGNFSLALGYNARAELGGDDSTTGNFGTAVGYNSVASGYGTALGGSARASYDNSAAIGYNAISGAANEFRLGNSSNVFVFGGNGVITGNGSGLTNLNLNMLSNRVVQAEVTNAVQQTALAGLTNSIANLNTNYIATTNGMSRNLTNLGAMYSDRLVVTNLVVGTNANKVQITNGSIIATGDITALGIVGNIFAAGGFVDAPRYTSYYQGLGRGGNIIMNVAEIGVVQMTDVNLTNFNRLAFGLINSSFPALKRNAASLEVTDAVGNSRATNNFIVPGVVISTNGFILPASTPFTAPASLSWQGSHLWSDGTNLCVVLQNSAGTRTTNKVTLTAWP